MKIYLLAIFSGLLLGLSFPPLPFGILAFIGFLPLFIGLESANGFRKKFFFLYLSFFTFQGITNWWVSSWQKEADPYLMVAGIALWIGHPFFFMLPVGLYLLMKRKFGRNFSLYTFPFLWTSFEWLHSLGEASYPWQTIGYSQVYHTYWVQIADIGGVWGISFLIILVNVILLQIFFFWREKNISLKENFFRQRFILLRSVLLFAIILLPIFYSIYEIKYFSEENFPRRISTGIIQPNINPWQKWNGDVDSQILLHKKIQDSLYTTYGPLDLAIWSETSIPFFLLQPENEYYFVRLKNWLGSSHTALLTGFPDVYFYGQSDEIPPSAKSFPGSNPTRFDTYNAALLLNSDGSRTIHHKMHLTPFAERVPYADALSFATNWLSWGVGISGYGLGKNQRPLPLVRNSDTTLIGTVICIESIYPNFVRKFAAQGAEMLAIITNDAWFDHTPGPKQHYAIAAMRAIETRRYIARCGNTGVSGFISPLGTSALAAPQYKIAGIAFNIPLIKEKSLYVLFGDWLPIACTFFSLCAIVFSRFIKQQSSP